MRGEWILLHGSECFNAYFQHEAVHLDVDVFVGFLRVVELVDLHELLQTLPQVQSKEVDPHQAAGIQNQLQGVELGVEVGTRDCRNRRGKKGRGLMCKIYT